ncbi:MAG TPA: biotin--[acetyl-CoA-carboxylase] ligase, partial [Anaerolineaceae bacterium]|nr:biotin--[acetyl-CoA-carboxylase] ligase [Anaerolineaceae bacterium]
MDSDQLLGILAGLPVPAVRYHEVTGSTNDDAMAWVGDGAPDGALVAANKQTRGRGRMDRQWLTPAGTALAFSLVLRPTQQEKIHLPLFSPLAALAVTDALDALGIHAEIKWPNDVLIQCRKVCGILAEAIWVGEELQAVVVGIGVNMTPESIPPADSVSFPADCVELATGAPVNRWALMAGIVEAIFAWRGWL